MAHYVMFTRLSPEALTRTESVSQLNDRIQKLIRQECPHLKWVANFAVLGPYDYMDIFEAPDADTAAKAALIIRSLGHASTETWVVTPWERFVTLSEVVKVIKT